jgi:hypothetical protein
VDDGRRCRAKSHRSGERCKKAAINGGTVCQTHGGGAPQVKAKAAERLAALVDPAIDTLDKSMKVDNPAVALAAAKDVLDRAGHKATDKVDSTVRYIVEWQSSSSA